MFKVMRDPKAAIEFAKQQNKILNKIRSKVNQDFYGKEAAIDFAAKQQEPVTEALERQTAAMNEQLPPIYQMLGKLAYKSGAELSSDELLSIFSDNAVANDLAVRAITEGFIPTIVEGVAENNSDVVESATSVLYDTIDNSRELSKEKKEFSTNLALRKLVEVNEGKDPEVGNMGADRLYNKLLNMAVEEAKDEDEDPAEIFENYMEKYEQIIGGIRAAGLGAYISPDALRQSMPAFEQTLANLILPPPPLPIIPEEPEPGIEELAPAEEELAPAEEELAPAEEELAPAEEELAPEPIIEEPEPVKKKWKVMTLKQLLDTEHGEDEERNIIKVLSTGETATVSNVGQKKGERPSPKIPSGEGKKLQQIKGIGKDVNDVGYFGRWDYNVSEVKVGDKSYYKLTRPGEPNSPDFAFDGYNNGALNIVSKKDSEKIIPITDINMDTKFGKNIGEGVWTSPGLKVLMAGKLSKQGSNNVEESTIQSNKKSVSPVDVAAYYILTNTQFGGNKVLLKKVSGAQPYKSLMAYLDDIPSVIKIANGLGKQPAPFIKSLIKTLIASDNQIGKDKAAKLIKEYTNDRQKEINDNVREKDAKELSGEFSGKYGQKGTGIHMASDTRRTVGRVEDRTVGRRVFRSPEEVLERTQMLIAAIDAGNNSPWIREELSQLYDLLRVSGYISKVEYKRLQTALMK